MSFHLHRIVNNRLIKTLLLLHDRTAIKSFITLIYHQCFNVLIAGAQAFLMDCTINSTSRYTFAVGY
jgi:hypothetical protein